ncbi:MAG: choice-of-anchor L domain-containing protein [Deltaproteobacteria bacterium]|nr:choice-of-anchor L domain-containing protein [Deltaproteobacteria bacterium]
MDLQQVRCAGRLGMAALLLTACPGGQRGEIDFTGTGAPTTGPGDTSGTTDPSGPADSTGDVSCNSDSDCAGNPNGEVCDVDNGVCGAPCEPDETRPCYSGPDGSDGVGACTAGVNVCNDEGRWDLWCQGEVVPAAEVCDNQLDDDCDGTVDDSDNDGDGFGLCSGDCCDIDGGTCTDAQLVNPGAFEVVGNKLDDDCDGDIDEAPQTCDAGLASNTSDAGAYAMALDLCQTTEESPADPLDRTWGVIDVSLTRADGTGSPLPVQHALRPDFGNLIDPEHGDRMVALSSGHAADASDTNPNFADFETGQNLGTSSDAPADWLAANGGQMPNPAGCLEPWNVDANDPVMLTMRVRAPTNASSFSVMTFFFSAEYPEWVCSEFNDFFVALVDSTADNPGDKNIAIYDDGDTQWPLGVNLVMVADGLFTQCENGAVGCASDLDSSYFGCVGDALLDGTGFDNEDFDACEPSQQLVGGGTGWLRMSGNVTPGEIFEIRFAIWDTSGHLFDSLVLLDDWEWSLDAAEPGVAPG